MSSGISSLEVASSLKIGLPVAGQGSGGWLLCYAKGTVLYPSKHAKDDILARWCRSGSDCYLRGHSERRVLFNWVTYRVLPIMVCIIANQTSKLSR